MLHAQIVKANLTANKFAMKIDEEKKTENKKKQQSGTQIGIMDIVFCNLDFFNRPKFESRKRKRF